MSIKQEDCVNYEYLVYQQCIDARKNMIGFKLEKPLYFTDDTFFRLVNK